MLIKNGTIVTAEAMYESDLRMEDGVIVKIRKDLEPHQGEEVVDASGLLVLPGGIDVHTHFDMPAGEGLKTSDDFYAGTKAAIAGGTTTILDFAEPEPGAPLAEGLKMWHEKADDQSFCDYSFHMTVSGWDISTRMQMEAMLHSGITTFKAYTAYKDGLGVDDKEMFRIMQDLKCIGGMLMVHCENGDVLECLSERLRKKDPANIENHPKSRPNLVEKEAISRVIDLAALADVPVYIVHVSTKEGLDVIQSAREKGQKVYAETCPHYLLLNDSKYKQPRLEALKYVMSPPLRKQDDQRALWTGLQEGVLDVVSTDHCAFNIIGQKNKNTETDFTKIPNGAPGVEQRVELMHHYGEKQGMSPMEITRLLSENPAKLMGIYPRKGVLQEGSDGDVVLLNPDCEHFISAATQYQKVDYTPYEGMAINKKVEHVFLRGKAVVKDGKVIAEQPSGRFLLCEKIK